MPRIFISTAEASAERHASHLVQELFATIPDLAVDAAGSEILRATGASLTVDMAGQAVMGFWEALAHLSFYRQAMQKILNRLEEKRPDALLVVDAPSFHLRLAAQAHKRWPNLPIIYYIAPKLWAWKEWRIKNLKRDFTRTMCIFPFEVDFFRKRGVAAVYVGNPTLDQLRTVDNTNMTRVLRVEDIRRHSDPARGVMAVFPGSRTSEIKYLWPVMTAAIAILRRRFPELKVAVALAPGMTKERLATFSPLPAGVRFVVGESQELLASSSVLLAKSGTTTLEAALLGIPMAVCYAGDAASFFIAKRFVKLPYVSLPNILAGKKIINEYLQQDATPENLAEEIGMLLSDRRYYKKMRSRLRALREKLGDERAAACAAREVATFIKQG